MKKCVVIFKAPSESEKDDNDAYYQAMSEDFRVYMVPVLDFEFINIYDFVIKLKTPSDYAGIIFTSPRTVEGFKLALSHDTSLLDQWKNHTHFVVGETTAQLILNLGLKAQGSEAGNANALSDIIKENNYERPFLYPIGNLAKDNLKCKLKESGILTDDIIIYKTRPHPALETTINSLVNRTTSLSYFIYFSPSGVDFTLQIFKKLAFDLKLVEFIAIGPTTEAALRANGLTVSKTATKPTPASLLEAVMSLQDQ